MGEHDDEKAINSQEEPLSSDNYQEKKNPLVLEKTEDIYSGTYADELCYIQMANNVKFAKFVKRNTEEIVINIDGEEERYEFLKKVDFNSERKMMSYVVRDKQNGKTFNFCKGADMGITSENHLGKLK